MEIVGEAQNAQEALDLVGDKKCDVLVLDIEMPGRSGLDVLKELKKRQPKLPVLVLSIHPAEQFAVRVLKAGGVGYLTKDREFEVLQMVASGKTVSQIAKELSFSVKTISTYRARVLAKMGMKTNAELTHYAIENKIV
jgi:two-component system invasion response regulator UvrY